MSKRPQSTGHLALQADASQKEETQNVPMAAGRDDESAVSPASVRPPATASTPGTGGPAAKRIEVSQNLSEQEGVVTAQPSVQQLMQPPHEYGYGPPNPGFPSASHPSLPDWRPDRGLYQPYQARFTNSKLHSSHAPAPWQLQHFLCALCLPF